MKAFNFKKTTLPSESLRYVDYIWDRTRNSLKHFNVMSSCYFLQVSGNTFVSNLCPFLSFFLDLRSPSFPPTGKIAPAVEREEEKRRRRRSDILQIIRGRRRRRRRNKAENAPPPSPSFSCPCDPPTHRVCWPGPKKWGRSGQKADGAARKQRIFWVRCKRKNKCRPLNLSVCARRSEISRRLERIPCILLLCLGLGKERWARGKKYLLFSRWRENYFTCQSDIPHASHAGSPAPKKGGGEKRPHYFNKQKGGGGGGVCLPQS